MVFWSLHANQATKSEFITQLNLYIGLSLLFFLPVHCFPEKYCQVIWTIELSQFSAWSSTKGFEILGIEASIAKLFWFGKSITTKFFIEFSLVQYWMFLFLKGIHVIWHVSFVLGSQTRKKYGDLCTEVDKDLHLTFAERAAGRREENWWQSSLVTGRELGELDPLQMQAGIPCWTIPGISWRRRTTPPQSPAQPSVCALFAVSPDNCKPTAAPPGSPGVCFGRRNSNPGESCGNKSRGLCQPGSLVSCFVLSVVSLISLFQGGLEDAAAFTSGKWKVLLVDFEKLVCVFG